jgi:tetratricopeptide (TPR) repeat protein
MMRKFVLTIGLSAAATLSAAAQTTADQIALGDRAYVSLDAPAALTQYERAIATNPRSYEALWKASRSAIDIGSYLQDESKRQALFTRGEQYARRAAELEPTDAEGHFAVARALGKTALTQSPRGRIRYATEIRSQALECLRLSPRHAGCLHVMGMWNAEVMRLNSLTRLIAKNVLGGRVFGAASWNEAVRYMEASVAADPERIVHHLDLAGVYRDTHQPAKARTEFETAIRLPITDFNDRTYQTEARSGLAALK